MHHELIGPSGSLQLLPRGALSISRGDERVLELRHAFVEVYGVTIAAQQLTACAIDGDLLRATFDTAQGMVITLEARATDDGFHLVWRAPDPAPLIGLAWATMPGGPWYGMGERVIQGWPLDELGVISQPFAPIDHASDGTLNIGTPLWLGAGGAGLLITEDTGPLAVTLNRDGDGLLRLLQSAPPVPFGAGLDGAIERPMPRLELRVLLSKQLPETWRAAIRHLGTPGRVPPADLLARPTWTTWARYKMHITQQQVLAFADEIIAHGYPYSVMEIDDRWQASYGELDFDRQKFPDPRAMVDALHARGFNVTLWVPPFFAPDSPAFAEAARHGHLLTHPATDEPALTRWWQGYGGLLDVSSPAALDWWLAGLRRLQDEYGIDGFKFDGAEANFVPFESRSAGGITATEYADRYVEFVARHFEWTEVRTGWRSQRHGILFREWDKISRWGRDNGLHAVLTQALTLGMIGYPFVLPDMIGGNAYAGEHPDGELMARWTQLTALLPAMQFSLAPWDYGAEIDAICLRYTQLHLELAHELLQLSEEALGGAAPLVRPLFWHAPDDQATYRIDDQFTLGRDLLVAPVMGQGQRSRSIYLPAGRWHDLATGQNYEGPQMLSDYPAPLEQMPLFRRI